MKKHDSAQATAAKGTPSKNARAGAPALDMILRQAYRRHARGKLALAAIAACLGR